MTFEELLRYSYLLRTAHQDGRDPDFYKRWDYRFMDFNMKGFAGVKTILYMARTRSITNPRKVQYKVIIQFNKVDFVKVTEQEDIDKYRKDKSYQDININGMLYFYKKPSLKEYNDAMVKCACYDFRFSFEWYNKQHKALVGQPRKYVSKHKLPPRNLNKTPGVCKHLFHFAKMLRDNNFVDRVISYTLWGQ